MLRTLTPVACIRLLQWSPYFQTVCMSKEHHSRDSSCNLQELSNHTQTVKYALPTVLLGRSVPSKHGQSPYLASHLYRCTSFTSITPSRVCHECPKVIMSSRLCFGKSAAISMTSAVLPIPTSELLTLLCDRPSVCHKLAKEPGLRPKQYRSVKFLSFPCSSFVTLSLHAYRKSCTDTVQCSACWSSLWSAGLVLLPSWVLAWQYRLDRCSTAESGCSAGGSAVGS